MDKQKLGGTILVTGCAGFIGSHLTERLLKDGYNVVGLDNFDLFYPRKFKEKNLEESFTNNRFTFYESDLVEKSIFEGLRIKPSMVIHIAARAGVLPSVKAPPVYLETNIMGTNNLLEWMKTIGCRKLLFASSSSIYGNNQKVPFSESDRVDAPLSPYAFTKRSCELMNYTYHHLWNIDVLNLRFFTVYGPRQRPDLAIHKFVGQLDKGLPIQMYGDGSSARDYTYITDIVNGVMGAVNYLYKNDNVYEVVNLGNNNPIALSKLIGMLEALMEKKAIIRQKPLQPGDVNRTYADISKAGVMFGYQPRIPFREGLKRFIEWYEEQKRQGIISLV